jgi:WD repeat and SOF domain-containing protein 1
VKVITHSAATVGRERRQDLPKMPLNRDPVLHPFERPREVVRAVNAVKVERLLARPFLGALEGHRDGVYCLARHAREGTALVTGAGDGSVRLWDVSRATEKGTGAKSCTWKNDSAHAKFVRGVVFLGASEPSTRFLTCSDDQTVKLWDTSAQVMTLLVT